MKFVLFVPIRVIVASVLTCVNAFVQWLCGREKVKCLIELLEWIKHRTVQNNMDVGKAHEMKSAQFVQEKKTFFSLFFLPSISVFVNPSVD